MSVCALNSEAGYQGSTRYPVVNGAITFGGCFGSVVRSSVQESSQSLTSRLAAFIEAQAEAKKTLVRMEQRKLERLKATAPQSERVPEKVEPVKRACEVSGEDDGYCYLRAVSSARRSEVAKKFGPYPGLDCLSRGLRVGDLDLSNTAAAKVFVMPQTSDTPGGLVYHVAEKCEVGRFVGTVSELVALARPVDVAVHGVDLTCSVGRAPVPMVGVVGASRFADKKVSGLTSESASLGGIGSGETVAGRSDFGGLLTRVSAVVGLDVSRSPLLLMPAGISRSGLLVGTGFYRADRFQFLKYRRGGSVQTAYGVIRLEASETVILAQSGCEFRHTFEGSDQGLQPVVVSVTTAQLMDFGRNLPIAVSSVVFVHNRSADLSSHLSNFQADGHLFSQDPRVDLDLRGGGVTFMAVKSRVVVGSVCEVPAGERLRVYPHLQGAVVVESCYGEALRLQRVSSVGVADVEHEMRQVSAASQGLDSCGGEEKLVQDRGCLDSALDAFTRLAAVQARVGAVLALPLTGPDLPERRCMPGYLRVQDPSVLMFGRGGTVVTASGQIELRAPWTLVYAPAGACVCHEFAGGLSGYQPRVFPCSVSDRRAIIKGLDPSVSCLTLVGTSVAESRRLSTVVSGSCVSTVSNSIPLDAPITVVGSSQGAFRLAGFLLVPAGVRIRVVRYEHQSVSVKSVGDTKLSIDLQ